MNPLGKLSPEALERLVYPYLGAAREEVTLGPRAGSDAALVGLGDGKVMAMTSDPLSFVPALGPQLSARLACHLLASDLWTTGIAPAYASVTLNLPPDMPEVDLGSFWYSMSDSFAALGVSVVTGHTGRYDGCDLTIVGAATLVGVGDEARTVGPAFVRPGDRVIVTKGCAIEAAAVAAHVFPRRMAERLGEDAVARLRGLIDSVSVVADCQAALGVGIRDDGVAMLHDATEGGVLGGLLETACACGHDLEIERAFVPLDDAVRGACDLMEIDPYWSLSEGTLVAIVRPGHATAVVKALEALGIEAADVGAVVAGSGRVRLAEPDGTETLVFEPEADPYWVAYARAVREGWR